MKLKKNTMRLKKNETQAGYIKKGIVFYILTLIYRVLKESYS
jgi:hypothetical protein